MAPASSLRLPEVNISLDDIERLRTVTTQIGEQAGLSLHNYYDETSGGFFHVLPPDATNKKGDFSKASTATAVVFLIDSGRWNNPAKDEPSWNERSDGLVRAIVDTDWDSAGLDLNNPFTSSFLLEVLAQLISRGAKKPPGSQRFLTQRQKDLIADLKDDGAINIDPHPTHAYLTHLAIRALRAWDDLDDGDRIGEIAEEVWDRALGDLSAELALLSATPERADIHQIGYSCMLLAELDVKPTPNTAELINHGLDVYFSHQLADGGWPLGRPLFHYPKYGNAYCFEFEFLVQLLSTTNLTDRNLLYLEKLDIAVKRLTRVAFDLPGGGNGWSSGHHQQLRYPESWSTASVLHFCFLLDRLLARASVVSASHYLSTPPILHLPADPTQFDALLDAEFVHDRTKHSLKQTLDDLLIKPVAVQDSKVASGRPMSDGTPVAAIMFGPPGTSKTTYAEAMARKIGWPLLTVDPSHLLRRGIDGVLPELNQLFRILNHVERVVIFLDEVDELVRERFDEAGDPSQRFITTAMLPKIARLRGRRRTVLIVATNHLEVFDTAIRRPGRFDMIIPVLPPTLAAKRNKWPLLDQLIGSTGLDNDDVVMDKLADLTYLECENLVRRLTSKTSKSAFQRAVNSAHESCSYMEHVPIEGRETPWKDVINGQLERVRLPPPPTS